MDRLGSDGTCPVCGRPLDQDGMCPEQHDYYYDKPWSITE